MAHKKEKGLTKANLIAELASRLDIPKSQAGDFFSVLFEIAAEELQAGRPLVIPNFVKLSVQSKKASPARPGKNPFTGESITIKAKPARTVVKVKPVSSMKDVLSFKK